MGQCLPLTRPRVLVVASNAVIGIDLADELERLGYAMAGSFTCARAADWLVASKPDLAILDVDLRSGPCVSLVRVLREQGVPVLVYTAHDQRHALPEFKSLPWLTMPLPTSALHAAVRALCPTPNQEFSAPLTL